MFTGIIHSSGVIESRQSLEHGARLRIRTTDDSPFTRGESVSVNGVCLTVIPEYDGALSCDLSNETLERTTLSSLESGARVNIERALLVSDRLGGHIVQGHVDAVGTLISIKSEGDFAVYRWSYPVEYQELVVNKGSVAVDGVSLTVIDAEDGSFGAALVPETLRKTTLGTAGVGSEMNLEFDMIAKYVRSLTAPYLQRKSRD